MGTYVDLDGIKGGRAEGPMVRSVSGFATALRSHRVASAAGDSGAVTVWIDDDGFIHCDHSAYQRTVEKRIFNRKAHAMKWLKPKLRLIAMGRDDI